MKSVISIFLLSVFLSPGLVKIWVVVDFAINQEYITELFCINKEEPITVCNGKCFLADQLKKTEAQEPLKLPVNTSQKVQIQLFLEESTDLENSRLIALGSTIWPAEMQLIYTEGHDLGVFHPPELI